MNATLRARAKFRSMRHLTVTFATLLIAGSSGCIDRIKIGDILRGSGGAGAADGGIASGGSTGTGGRTMAAAGRSGGWATGGNVGTSDGGASTSKLDVLFMIDNSASMKPLQAKLAAQLPSFINGLRSLPGGLPDLHLAVISSSLGAGAFGDVPGCVPGAPGGDDGGRFQHKVGCGLNAGETFLKSEDGGNNFTGSLSDVFSCIAQLGDGGCGFEHQLESTRVALMKAEMASDPDNGGFLRADAKLAIVMLTNEDDCSVPPESQLFDTSVALVADQPPLGGLWSYRCNEFGHKCDQPMPHTANGLPLTMTGCVSKEDTNGMYHLTPVADFVTFLKGLKSAPNDVFVAALAGPLAPYVVHARTAQTGSGVTEQQPEVSHACTATDGTYADPSIRLSSFVSAFGVNGDAETICADSFAPAIANMVTRMTTGLGL